MRLNKFESNGITLRYIIQHHMTPQSATALIVVLTNPCTEDGAVELMFTLNGYKSTERLYIANDHELRKGIFLMRNGKWVIRDVLIELIEQTRVENRIDRENVYIIGYCSSSVTAFHICLEKGYKGILSIFAYNKFCMWDYLAESRYIADFHRRWLLKLADLHISADFFEDYHKYTGRPDFSKFNQEAVEHCKNVGIKMWLHYGRYEELYNMDGKETIEALKKSGIEIDCTIDEDEYDHFLAPPYFVKFLLATFNKLNI